MGQSNRNRIEYRVISIETHFTLCHFGVCMTERMCRVQVLAPIGHSLLIYFILWRFSDHDLSLIFYSYFVRSIFGFILIHLGMCCTTIFNVFFIYYCRCRHRMKYFFFYYEMNWAISLLDQIMVVIFLKCFE